MSSDIVNSYVLRDGAQGGVRPVFFVLSGLEKVCIFAVGKNEKTIIKTTQIQGYRIENRK